MTTPKELETKLETAPKSLRILEKPTYPQPSGDTQGRHRSLVYFDIPKRNLHKKRLLLRVRRIGHGYTQH